MPRTRQANVHAAQWSPNGSALGTADLTAPDPAIFGANVFGPAVQRRRLPKDVYQQAPGARSSTARRSTRRSPTRSPRR